MQSPEGAYEVEEEDVYRWLIYRCWNKVCSRFEIAQREWEVAPWVTMENWSQTGVHYNVPSCSIDLPEDLCKLIQDTCDSPEIFMQSPVPFNSTTVRTWIRCLAKLLSEANELTIGSKSKERDALSTSAYIAAIYTILYRQEIQDVFLKSTLPLWFAPKTATSESWTACLV